MADFHLRAHLPVLGLYWTKTAQFWQSIIVHECYSIILLLFQLLRIIVSGGKNRMLFFKRRLNRGRRKTLTESFSFPVCSGCRGTGKMKMVIQNSLDQIFRPRMVWQSCVSNCVLWRGEKIRRWARTSRWIRGWLQLYGTSHRVQALKRCQGCLELEKQQFPPPCGRCVVLSFWFVWWIFCLCILLVTLSHYAINNVAIRAIHWRGNKYGRCLLWAN